MYVSLIGGKKKKKNLIGSKDAEGESEVESVRIFYRASERAKRQAL